MTLILTYGEDGVGKSVQHVNMAKNLPDSIYLSLEIKDEELLVASGINAVPVLKIHPENYTINEPATLATLNTEIEKILRGSHHNVFIDGISQLRKFAIDTTLMEENQQRISEGKPVWQKIPEKAFGIWEVAGNRVFQPLDRLSNWSHARKTNVFLTGRMKKDFDTGQSVLDFKEFVRFSVDAKVRLAHDGRGYTAKFEKVPDWAAPGAADVAVDKMGLLAEFAKRGLIR